MGSTWGSLHRLSNTGTLHLPVLLQWVCGPELRDIPQGQDEKCDLASCTETPQVNRI